MPGEAPGDYSIEGFDLQQLTDADFDTILAMQSFSGLVSDHRTFTPLRVGSYETQFAPTHGCYQTGAYATRYFGRGAAVISMAYRSLSLIMWCGGCKASPRGWMPPL